MGESIPSDNQTSLSQAYSRAYPIRWADLDGNGHVRHTAYGDYAVDTRLQFMSGHDFSPARFQEMRLGPIIVAETTRFSREVLIGEIITMTFVLAGLPSDGSISVPTSRRHHHPS